MHKECEWNLNEMTRLTIHYSLISRIINTLGLFTRHPIIHLTLGPVSIITTPLPPCVSLAPANQATIDIFVSVDIAISLQPGETKKPTKSTFAETLPNLVLTRASFTRAWRKKRIYHRRLCIYTLAEAFLEKASSSHQISLMSFLFVAYYSDSVQRWWSRSKVSTVTEDSWGHRKIVHKHKGRLRKRKNKKIWKIVSRCRNTAVGEK